MRGPDYLSILAFFMGYLHRIVVVAAVVATAMLAVFSVHLVLSGGDPRRAWAGFRGTMETFGAFMGRAIFTVLYFSIFIPFALIGRSKDPMRLRGPARWIARRTRDLTLADAQKQG